MDCWEHHFSDAMFWVLRDQPLIELGPWQLYDLPSERVVDRDEELTPGEFYELNYERFHYNSDRMFCMWMTVNNRRHAVCFPALKISSALFPRHVFFQNAATSGNAYMKHLVLSRPPEAPGKVVPARRYVDKRKAVAFLLGDLLPCDMLVLIVRQFLDSC